QLDAAQLLRRQRGLDQRGRPPAGAGGGLHGGPLPIPTAGRPVSGRGRRIAVLKGGRSLEREVSLRSGANVEGALRRLGEEVIAVDADQHLVRTLRAEQPAVAFPAPHGKVGSDGTGQG